MSVKKKKKREQWNLKENKKWQKKMERETMRREKINEKWIRSVCVCVRERERERDV